MIKVFGRKNHKELRVENWHQDWKQNKCTVDYKVNGSVVPGENWKENENISGQRLKEAEESRLDLSHLDLPSLCFVLYLLYLR